MNHFLTTFYYIKGVGNIAVLFGKIYESGAKKINEEIMQKPLLLIVLSSIIVKYVISGGEKPR